MLQWKMMHFFRQANPSNSDLSYASALVSGKREIIQVKCQNVTSFKQIFIEYTCQALFSVLKTVVNKTDQNKTKPALMKLNYNECVAHRSVTYQYYPFYKALSQHKFCGPKLFL